MSTELKKHRRGSMDHRFDAIFVKWVDSSVVQLATNIVGIETMSE